MRRALDRDIEEIVESQSIPSTVELSDRKLAAQHRDDLEIDQLGCSQTMTAQAHARNVAVLAVICQGGRQYARVNDEHGRFERLWPRPSA